VYEEKKDMLDQIKAVQNQQVYDTQGRGPNMWNEQRLAEYDIVALDFCDLVGTGVPGSVHKRQWFRNIFTEPIGTVGECNIPDEINEPYVPKGAQCTPIADGDSSSSSVEANKPLQNEQGGEEGTEGLGSVTETASSSLVRVSSSTAFGVLFLIALASSLLLL